MRGVFTASVLAVAGAAPVMEGYDVVAYHGLSKGDSGVLGHPSINSTLTVPAIGVAYDFYFSSQENKDHFDADPWRFAPK